MNTLYSQSCSTSARREIKFKLAGLTFADAGVAAAEAVPLLAVAVQPDAEDHEDDPAGRADARDEGRLTHHV